MGAFRLSQVVHPKPRKHVSRSPAYEDLEHGEEFREEDVPADGACVACCLGGVRPLLETRGTEEVFAAGKPGGDMGVSEGVVADGAFGDRLEMVVDEGGFRGKCLAAYGCAMGMGENWNAVEVRVAWE